MHDQGIELGEGCDGWNLSDEGAMPECRDCSYPRPQLWTSRSSIVLQTPSSATTIIASICAHLLTSVPVSTPFAFSSSVNGRAASQLPAASPPSTAFARADAVSRKQQSKSGAHLSPDLSQPVPLVDRETWGDSLHCGKILVFENYITVKLCLEGIPISRKTCLEGTKTI